MTDQTNTTPAATEVKPVRSLNELQGRVIEALGQANDISVVVNDIELKSVGGKSAKVLTVGLEGDGVGNPTRRYYLRNSSRIERLSDGSQGIYAYFPRKERGVATYFAHFAMNQAILEAMEAADNEPKAKEPAPAAEAETTEAVESAEPVAAEAVESAESTSDEGETAAAEGELENA